MAGDWIKIQESTPDKPEVWRIAKILSIDPDAVTGKLIRVWSWASQNCHADGVTDPAVMSLIDRVAGIDGFASAMQGVGWLVMSSERIMFPNFDRHISNPAKERSLSNERQKRKREKAKIPDKNVTEMSRSERDDSGTLSSLLFSSLLLDKNNSQELEPEPVADDLKPFFQPDSKSKTWLQDSRFMNAGRRPLKKYDLIWISPPELRGAFERYEAAGIPKNKYKLVFAKVQQRLTDWKAAGKPTKGAAVSGWLTGWAMQDVLSELKKEQDLERSSIYLDNAGV